MEVGSENFSKQRHQKKNVKTYILHRSRYTHKPRVRLHEARQNIFRVKLTPPTYDLQNLDFNSSYAASSVRPLTLTLLNNMIRNLRIDGGAPKCILTGYDTIQAIADLLQSQERFMDRKEIIPTHNGVRGIKGAEVGFRVATYYDIPLIPCKDMTSTLNASDSGISDLLFLDTDHLWLSVLKPTQYFEDGVSNGNPFGVGRLGNQALYRTIGEVGCSFFKGQGKITNLL